MDMGNSFDTDAIPADTQTVLISDRRSASRQISVMLFAKLVANGHQLPCRVLNLSIHGAKIESNIPLAPDHKVVIEFRSDLAISGTVRWVHHRKAGIHFDTAIDLVSLLRRSEVRIERIKPRPPRYRCDAKVAIKTDAQWLQGNVVDISNTGLKVCCPNNLHCKTEVMVEIERMPRRKAQVAWSSAETVGLRFINPFKYQELELWLLRHIHAGQIL
jgi:hypothetical protein